MKTKKKAVNMDQLVKAKGAKLSHLHQLFSVHETGKKMETMYSLQQIQGDDKCSR